MSRVHVRRGLTAVALSGAMSLALAACVDDAIDTRFVSSRAEGGFRNDEREAVSVVAGATKALRNGDDASIQGHREVERPRLT